MPTHWPSAIGYRPRFPPALAWLVPRMYHACTWLAPPNPLPSTWLVPRMYLALGSHWCGFWVPTGWHAPPKLMACWWLAGGLWMACGWLVGGLWVAFEVECPGQFLELCDPGAPVVPSCPNLSRRDGSRMCHPGTLSRRRRVSWKAETTGPARWSARVA